MFRLILKNEKLSTEAIIYPEETQAKSNEDSNGELPRIYYCNSLTISEGQSDVVTWKEFMNIYENETVNVITMESLSCDKKVDQADLCAAIGVLGAGISGTVALMEPTPLGELAIGSLTGSTVAKLGAIGYIAAISGAVCDVIELIDKHLDCDPDKFCLVKVEAPGTFPTQIFINPICDQ